MLLYGNLGVFEVWRTKTLAAFEDIDLPTTGDYASEAVEICVFANSSLPIFSILGLHAEGNAMLNALGFTLDKAGFVNIDAYCATLITTFQFLNEKCESVHLRLLLLLLAPDGAIDVAQVNEWIPSPVTLAEMERDCPSIRVYSMYDLTSSGARAFLKLGRDDDAYELARLAVAPEQQTEKKTTLVACHSILGQVAAKRGHLDEAERHFARALEEAKLSRLPMLELIAARDWKATNRDCSAAEAAIDEACIKMKKTRDKLSSVLSF